SPRGAVRSAQGGGVAAASTRGRRLKSMLGSLATMKQRSAGGWVARLREFTYPPAPTAVCELCSAPSGEPHPHLFELSAGRLLCCCRGCALLFGERDAARYRRVPESIASFPDLELSDAQWEALDIPV